ISAATMRASASTGPPAANGTTILMGSAACAGTASIAAAASAPNRRFMTPPDLSSCWRHAAINATRRERGMEPRSPALRTRCTFQHFVEPRSRAARRLAGQRVGREKAVIDDLAGVARPALLRKVAHHEDRDMIAARDARVKEDAVQDGRAARRNAAL